MAAESFWHWNGRAVSRDELLRLTLGADRKAQDWQRRAERAAGRVARGSGATETAQRAEREGRHAEREYEKWKGQAQQRMAALAAGDKKKREGGAPPPGKWRYWVRLSYSAPQHENVTEVYFNERNGKRLTDAEAVDAVTHVLHGKAQAHVKWNRVMYGRRTANKRAKRGDEVIFAFALEGDVEQIGEQMYRDGEWVTVRVR